MSHETDFLELYRRLGLNPGCGLDELKQAYRRHVAALHPDRQHGRPVDVRAAPRLQRLTAQYGAAMDFHRRHGRLPGAPGAGPTVPPSDGRALSSTVREMPDPFASRRGGATQFTHADSVEPTAPRRSHARLAALLVIVALATLGWAMHSASLAPAAPREDDEAEAQAGTGSVSHEAAVDQAMLHAGMSADDVRAVEGEPLAIHGELWEYGPSWIRFDHDQVVEWHSSPLRPLHTDARPAR